ncbi:hypothetical protein [Sulfuracidifex tepidarius]|uniref:hypothetical protein n=1 Tax=Sulfuracidifex tepidarius TaxID=1294262 RepID=UPI0006D20D16|nr:hypothetical protein [Sulfuracidifex tepidarius]
MSIAIKSWDEKLSLRVRNLDLELENEEIREIVNKVKKIDLGIRESQPKVSNEISEFCFSFPNIEVKLLVDWTSQDTKCLINGKDAFLSRLSCFGVECTSLGIMFSRDVQFLIFSLNERRAFLHILVLDINSFINEIIFYKLNKKFKVAD